jgi:hypothetical protein
MNWLSISTNKVLSISTNKVLSIFTNKVLSSDPQTPLRLPVKDAIAKGVCNCRPLLLLNRPLFLFNRPLLLPSGSLSKAQVQKGFEVLQEIDNELKKPR